MRKKLLVVVISGLLFTACQNSDSSSAKNAFDSSIVTSTKTITAITDSSTAVQPPQNTMQTLPTAGTVVTNPTTTTVSPATTTITPATAAAAAVTAPGMNPAHGQPGHRCDISVGAPLNSAPAKTTTPAITTPSVVTTTPTPALVKTAPGMNPPHGEPGHKCEIAVGAPLNSAPAKPAATTIKSDAQSKTADAIPASIKVDTSKKQ